MRESSDIQHLRVAHWPKSPGRSRWPTPAAADFVMDTCLRQIRIRLMPADTFPSWRPHLQREYRPTVPELRSGDDAYRFLLEVTTGLRSAIPGETNVFGQFKKAWLSFRCTGPAADVTRLAPVMHRLFNDTKSVRREHLEGIGGSSYGSLVRKLIAPKPGDRILFVGAGDLARSMLPLFSSHRLGIWNHRNIEAPHGRIECIFLPNQGKRAASWADHVILTTPGDSRNDANWHRWLTATRVQTVVHLGHRKSQSPEQLRTRGNTPACYDLDDVFALRRGQDDLRSDHLTLARMACRQRAQAFVPTDRHTVYNNATADRLTGQRSTRHAGLALA